jgi:hypothetical protein
MKTSGLADNWLAQATTSLFCPLRVFLNSTTSAGSNEGGPPPKTQDPQPEPSINPRTVAVWDAQELIREFIDEDWSHNAVHISIDCDLTLTELLNLGALPTDEGSRACRQLIRVPVIHEEVAAALWAKLAAQGSESTTPCHPEEAVDANPYSKRSSLSSCSPRSSTSAGASTPAPTPSPPNGRTSPLTKTKKQKQQQQKQKQKRSRKPTSRKCAYCSNNCTANDNHRPHGPAKLVKLSPYRGQYEFWQQEEAAKPRQLPEQHSSVGRGTPPQTRGRLLTKLRGLWPLSWAPRWKGSWSSGEALLGEPGEVRYVLG